MLLLRDGDINLSLTEIIRGLRNTGLLVLNTSQLAQATIASLNRGLVLVLSILQAQRRRLKLVLLLLTLRDRFLMSPVKLIKLPRRRLNLALEVSDGTLKRGGHGLTGTLTRLLRRLLELIGELL